MTGGGGGGYFHSAAGCSHKQALLKYNTKQHAFFNEQLYENTSLISTSK